ncbi:MAG: PIG-L deacetylase family protein [Anaerolineae bacterium]
MTDSVPRRAMVIMAHPDDPEFSVGGTIALWTAAGAEITYLILTNGNKGHDDPAMTPERLAVLRQEEQKAAADVLGVRQVLFFDEPDGELVPTLAVRQRVVAEIRRHQPEAIIAPDPTRYFFRDVYINHPDHRAAGEIALAAIFPAAGNRMYHPELLAAGLEPYSVKEVWLANASAPNRWVDITAVFQTKLEAIRCHVSQVREPENLEERLRERSQAIDEYGRTVYREGFHRLVMR